MDTQEIDGRERGLGVLAISYLFWHLFSAAIGVALLAFTTRAYAGVIEVTTALPGSVDIAGASVSGALMSVTSSEPGSSRPHSTRSSASPLASALCLRARATRCLAAPSCSGA